MLTIFGQPTLQHLHPLLPTKSKYKMMTITRSFRILALLSMFATRQVASNDIMVTCSVDEGTRSIDDCDLPPAVGGTTNVWYEVSEVLRTCSQLGLERGLDAEAWTLYSLEPKRNLRQQDEQRELGTCSGTCYSPWSSCCLLWSGFCAGICGSGCDCNNRRLSEADEIENVLANNNSGKDAELSNNDVAHAPRRTQEEHREAVIADCVAMLEQLRTTLLALPTPNLCLAASTESITCNAFSSEFTL
jgi:hypothetical protein